MPRTTVMMLDSQDHVEFTGEACKADGWHERSNGLHTLSIQVVNFTGRIYVEASLVLAPADDDWFAVDLMDQRPYVQFPRNPMKPTGSVDTGGDTGTYAISIHTNALWLRVKLCRDYLGLTSGDFGPLTTMGQVVKIVMAH